MAEFLPGDDILKGRMWAGSVYAMHHFAPNSSESIVFPSRSNTLRCPYCMSYIGKEGNVRAARLWTNTHGNTLLEVNIYRSLARCHQWDEEGGLCFYTCWRCSEPLSVNSNGKVFGTDEMWTPAKLNGKYLLLKQPFRILFCSLNLDVHEACVSALQAWAAAHPTLTIKIDTYELPLAQLRSGTSFSALSPAVDLVIIAHHAEGRLLLTDEDGLYNTFIGQACAVSIGNVVILITSEDVNETTHDMDPDLLTELVECGQESAECLHLQQRLLSCNDVFSANQMGMLEMHVSRASKPLEVPPGIAKKIMTKTEGQSGISSSNSLCQLL